MAYLLYDLIVLLVLALLAPVQLARRITGGKRREGVAQRLGFFGGMPDPPRDGALIWVHAVSVGETVAARPLLAALPQRFPGCRIALSSVTETGRQISDRMKGIDYRLYFPFDTGFAARRCLRRLRPSLVVIVETEIWPGFLNAAAAMGVPVVLANGRISDRSFPRYMRFRFLLRPVLRNISVFCMQSKEDARRIIALGAPEELVAVTGNLKYDVPAAVPTAERRCELRERYRIPQDATVFIAASTHPGEEEPLFKLAKSLSATTDFRFILVPRHPERGGEVAGLAEREGFVPRRRTLLEADSPELGREEVLLVDTVGELMDLYAASDLVFVGGSLVGVGGHNLLEPASVGLPVLFGPHMSNFREISAMVEDCGGGLRVDDADGLRLKVAELLRDGGLRSRMGGRSLAMVEGAGGSTEAHLRSISHLLKR